MTAQDKLNKAAQSHGWANWAEVLLHNAPAHVINLVVEDAMRTEPALEWRPGARVRITGNTTGHSFRLGEYVNVVNKIGSVKWVCYNGSFGQFVRESDAVVVE